MSRSGTDTARDVRPVVRSSAAPAPRRARAALAREPGALTLGVPLPRAFYARGARVVAHALLGCVLVHDDAHAGRSAGIIVETEAYGGSDDPASHAWHGETPRNRVMFGPPGHAYVYFTYGMHHCFNVVCGPAGRAMAVLVRALEPLAGTAVMARRRGTADPARWTRGPGMLTQALGLDRRHDGADLTAGALWLARRPAGRPRPPIACGARVGIRRAVERPWRYWLTGSPFVSGRSVVEAGAVRSARTRA